MDRKNKGYGTNIDFNSYGLRPAGSYFNDFPSLFTSISEADKAADDMIKEFDGDDVLKPESPKTKAEEAEDTPNLDELLAELDSLTGLEDIKKNVRSLINLAKIRKLREEKNLPTPAMSLHLVFMGNPGTGKTTVARLIGRLYAAIGVLSKGRLVEVDRSGLVAGFVGQTAMKTDEVVKKAVGGVLFIDEAYALTSKEGTNDFGHEAVETLLKAMEDHRDDLVVIVAGYEDLMEQFISSNPGLESRFNRYFVFPDYSGEELYEIFRSMCAKNQYKTDESAEKFAKRWLKDIYDTRDENFGNARTVRNFFENAVSAQADRLAKMDAPQKEDLTLFTKEDLKTASEM